MKRLTVTAILFAASAATALAASNSDMPQPGESESEPLLKPGAASSGAETAADTVEVAPQVTKKPQPSLDMVTGTDPDALMLRMQTFGFLATMSADDYDDPMIESRVSKSRFRVIFYDCTDNVDCRSIRFSAGYDLSNGMGLSAVNTWNNDNRYAKVVLDDEDDPYLLMDVNLDAEGVGAENFEDTLDTWRVLVEDFEETIDW